MRGTVRFFDPERAFGFIYSSELGGDAFVHAAGIIPGDNGLKVLQEGDEVEFESSKEPKGIKARRVKLVKKGEADGKEIRS